MHIFIDESGTFTQGRKGSSVSVVGALIVPTSRLARVEEKYAAIRADLPTENGEVKGRKLAEQHVKAVVAMLKRYHVLFEATAVDMSIHSPMQVERHKVLQAEGITEGLSEESHPKVRGRAFDLRRRLERLNAQLYVQSAVTFPLIETVIHNAIKFYCQRIPTELGAFHWVIDGKDRGRTTSWENWWSRIVSRMLEARSWFLDKPLETWKGCDYSHLWRFGTDVGEHLKPHTPYREAIDLVQIMEDSFRFSDKPEPGLELVDILTSATRRALVGHLGESGWGDIRHLMIHRGGSYIQDVILTEVRSESGTMMVPCSYAPVLRKWSQGGKNMIAPRFRGRS